MATTHWIDCEVALSSLNCPDPLQRLQSLIPWEQFRGLLESRLYPPRVTPVGRKPFDAIMMFKVLLLQTLYNLSDGQTWLEHPTKYQQKDMDARWTRKHGQNYYGYKNHVSVDGRHCFIRRFQATPASTNDGQLLPKLLDARCPQHER